MFHPEDQHKAREVWCHSLHTGETYEIEYRLRHRSGQYRWTLGRALPVRSESGAITRWIGTCTDIHEQKLAAEDLKEAGQRKDEFLAMLAHELRNPLAPVSVAADLLGQGQLSGDKLRQTSDIIGRQVRHMTRLVDHLLDVSRVNRGLVELKTRPVDLRQIIHDAVEQICPLIHTRRQHLKLSLSADTGMLIGDEKRLVQVVGEKPDAYLLDIGLPKLDGNKLAARLRADSATASLLLIAINGYGQAQDRQRSLAAGFDHYLVKPVDPVELDRLLACASAH